MQRPTLVGFVQALQSVYDALQGQTQKVDSALASAGPNPNPNPNPRGEPVDASTHSDQKRYRNHLCVGLKLCVSSFSHLPNEWHVRHAVP